MFVGVVVLPGAVVDLTAWVAAFDLDGRVADREPVADPALQVANDMLGVAKRAVPDDHVAAERNLL
jgi:hypothetical protein